MKPGNNVRHSFWGVCTERGGAGGGGTLTRSQRGEVARSVTALPWGFVKPIDCDRVPAFLLSLPLLKEEDEETPITFFSRSRGGA